MKREKEDFVCVNVLAMNEILMARSPLCGERSHLSFFLFIMDQAHKEQEIVNAWSINKYRRKKELAPAILLKEMTRISKK